LIRQADFTIQRWTIRLNFHCPKILPGQYRSQKQQDLVELQDLIGQQNFKVH
jgi:hypothetical protein